MTNLDEAREAGRQEGRRRQAERITAIFRYALLGRPEKFELARDIAFESNATVAEAWKAISEARK